MQTFVYRSFYHGEYSWDVIKLFWPQLNRFRSKKNWEICKITPLKETGTVAVRKIV